MAAINILAKSTTPLSWGNLLQNYSRLNLTNIEIFPIPSELGFEGDSIGISVSQGYTKRETVLTELKILIDFLNLTNLTFIELYDGIEVLPDNIVGIIEKMLPK